MRTHELRSDVLRKDCEKFHMRPAWTDRELVDNEAALSNKYQHNGPLAVRQRLQRQAGSIFSQLDFC